jgi:hypothetical protein
MPVRAERQEAGPGWGCSCRAFRRGEPTPEQALAALARSANVTVEFRAEGEFVAWTDPADRYEVTFDPYKPGGWCKHCVACLSHLAPWHRQLALGAGDALDEIKRLRKEIKKLERENERLRRKAS